MQAENLEGLIPLVGGAVAMLMVFGKIQLSEKNRVYLQKHRKLLKPASIIVTLWGLLLLTGVGR